MSTDKKFTKAYLPKIIELGEFLGALLDKLAGPLIKVGVSLAKYFLAPLATIASALDSDIQKKKKKKENAWNKNRCCKGKERNHLNHFEWKYGYY